MAAAVPAAKLEDAEALIDSVETFIFDCDGERPIDRSRSASLVELSPINWLYTSCSCCCRVGVIWKGDKLIDGVPETLDLLRSKVCWEL
jgi:phosphoglycolate phosphatase